MEDEIFKKRQENDVSSIGLVYPEILCFCWDKEGFLYCISWTKVLIS